ncbi:hypothetical protein CY35_13G082300 [Sphagnum magellanicum]|nr:hypothetical protein CY35_13G082300 [Sphagnum magellanicum]
MVGTATFVGAALGFSIQIFSNGVRKLPLMRHPWEHVLAAGLGATFGNAMVKWEVHLQEDLDKRLQEVQSANKKRFIGASFSLLCLSPLQSLSFCTLEMSITMWEHQSPQRT